MPPIAKENEISTARLETGQRPASTATLPGDAAIRQQPVALEVPVSVNGARAVDGSDKREPFSESTKTVLIFGSGAVIRLSSSVAPGQLLFLTNEKTKKEVVCQVVKSKNYRNVSGYVELEFTEPVVGFWGMRFPGDRLSSVAQPVAPKFEAPATTAAPSVVAPKPAAPVLAAKNNESKVAESKIAASESSATQIPPAPKIMEPVVQKPVAPVARLTSTLSSSFDPEAPLNIRPTTPPAVTVVPAQPVTTIPEVSMNSAPERQFAQPSELSDSLRSSEAQASFLEPPKTPAAGSTPSVTNLLALFDGKPSTPPSDPAPAVQVFVDPETETLKQHTARLQEQLSGMMFSGERDASSTISVQTPHASPVIIKKDLVEDARKVLQASQVQAPEAPAAVPVVPVKPEPTKSLLEDEELKIPAWLEPLARNAAAPSSTQELIEREKAKRLAEQIKVDESEAKVEQIAADPIAAREERHVPELPLPTFGDVLPLDDVESKEERRSRSSNKLTLIGAIAAGLLLLAGAGWWYTQQQPGGLHIVALSASNEQASVASMPEVSAPSQPQNNPLPQKNLPAPSNPAPLTTAAPKSIAASNHPNVVPASATTAVPRNLQPASIPAKGGAVATMAASAEPAPEPKKPALGEVHLATPKVTSGKRAVNAAEPDPGVILNNDDQPESSADALNAGLVGANKQPAAPSAPIPVGGDVKAAKLISSVAPVYPMLARSQHVSGNVQVDALIDATGHVTNMKVVSGPAPLQQAAMDALRQWKYQPATLDGKAVPMHLTVTLQFRPQ